MNTSETQFSSCFAALLDAKIGYNKARWARYLVVSRAAITQWTSGIHIPGPDKLLKVLAKFEQPAPEEQQALDAFEAMAGMPIASVTNQPHKFKGAATIADFICNYRIQNIGINAQSLPLQVRLEAISHYAAVTQSLDAHFVMPDKKQPQEVRAVAENMKRFRATASNFEFLYGEQHFKPHSARPIYAILTQRAMNPFAVRGYKLGVYYPGSQIDLEDLDSPILEEEESTFSHMIAEGGKQPNAKKI
jgi:hypothetical protein